MKILIIILMAPTAALAGPYVELGMDYDPNPASFFTEAYNEDGVLEETSRTQASHYTGIASVGWEWDARGLISERDSVTFRLKVFEHRSDILHEGQEDIVNENKIRGVSVKYRFW